MLSRTLPFAIGLGVTTLVSACIVDPTDMVDETVETTEAPLTTTSFTATFKRDVSGACVSAADYPIIGFAPATTGRKYPLFIFTVGTGMPYDDVYTQAILKETAARGFVAVSPSYRNTIMTSCLELSRRSKCNYDPTQAHSVVSKMCARPDVDCSRGIVTSGHSQGAQLAIHAKNFDTRVLATWALGATCDYLFSYGQGDSPGMCSPTNLAAACLLDANTALPSDCVRIVNGANESYGHQNEYQRMSGMRCAPGATECLRPNGSGWYIVANTEVQDGNADHGYFAHAGGLDPGFATPSTKPWSLPTNVDWLKSFTRLQRDAKPGISPE